jgi:hypothetical protein
MRAMVLEKGNQALPITQSEQVFLTPDDLDRFLELRKRLKKQSVHEMRERKVKAFLSRCGEISDPHLSSLKKEMDQRSSLEGKSLVLATWLASILSSAERTIEG